jgi:hypothetical protein
MKESFPLPGLATHESMMVRRLTPDRLARGALTLTGPEGMKCPVSRQATASRDTEAGLIRYPSDSIADPVDSLGRAEARGRPGGAAPRAAPGEHSEPA